MSSIIKSQDKAIEDGEDILTLRKLLRGNSQYFVTCIGDTGYDFEDHRVRIFIKNVISYESHKNSVFMKFRNSL